MTSFVMEISDPIKDTNKLNESRFNLELKGICKGKESKLSKRFSKIDQELSNFDEEIKDEWKHDFIDKCYYNRNFLAKYHGKSTADTHCIKVSLSSKVVHKKDKDSESQPSIKIKRSVVYNPNATELSDVEDEIPKEEYFLKVKDILNKLSEKFKKSEEDLTEAYVSVSGDIEELTKLLEGKRVTQWSYLDDLALGKDRNSEEFKAVLEEKGKDEINKRIAFLIQAQGDDCEEN